MEMLDHALHLMTKNCSMVSVDSKDEYYSVPIHEAYQKFLKFSFDGQLYCFTAFANGLAPCPRLFTKLMKPVLAHLRKQGTLVTSFIDDSFLVDSDYAGCAKSIVDMISLVDSLGFVVHSIKSVLQPTQAIVYLGFVLNSVNMTVRLTPERAAKVKQACQSLLQKSSPSIRKWRKLWVSVWPLFCRCAVCTSVLQTVGN